VTTPQPRLAGTKRRLRRQSTHRGTFASLLASLACSTTNYDGSACARCEIICDHVRDVAPLRMVSSSEAG
jgi:hypothetical protein